MEHPHPGSQHLLDEGAAKNIATAQGVPLVEGGDGRADSPDHCAKYGSYTIHDLKQNKVLDLQLVQVSFILYMY